MVGRGKMDNIQTLDWIITTQCNDGCQFCYAPSNFEEANRSLDFYLMICDKIKDAGFKNVGICGGEPTKFQFLTEVIKYLHLLDIDVSLYTNCTNKEIIMDVIDYLYAISIPLDSISYIDIMRNEKHFVNVLDVLNFLENKNNLQTIVKIGTVVTKANIHEISRICEFISTYKKINVWKLYQYSPGGRCQENSKKFEIDKKQFKEATSKIVLENKKIITRTREQTKGYCVLMSQSGDFYLYDEEYIPTYTNIFKDSIDTITQLYNGEENKKQKDWK